MKVIIREGKKHLLNTYDPIKPKSMGPKQIVLKGHEPKRMGTTGLNGHKNSCNTLILPFFFCQTFLAPYLLCLYPAICPWFTLNISAGFCSRMRKQTQSMIGSRCAMQKCSEWKEQSVYSCLSLTAPGADTFHLKVFSPLHQGGVLMT